MSRKQNKINVASIYASTYACESTFSVLNYVKNKYRSPLKDNNFEAEMRRSVASEAPDLKKLTIEKDCKISH